MAVTSVMLNGLEIASGDYGVGQTTLAALEAGVPRKGILAAVAGDHPEFVRVQVSERTIPVTVFLLSINKTLRRAAFAQLEAAADGGLPVRLQWTAEGVTRYFTVTVGAFVPDGWYHRASAAAVAADPTPGTV